jgi:hypothetical protein
VVILQVGLPILCIYRVLSRNYGVYSYFGPENAIYPRAITNFYPTIILDILNFQLFFKRIYWPTPQEIQLFQLLLIFPLVFIIFGILPRFSSIISALGLVILHGFMESTNSEIDGGTIMVLALFWMGIQPKLNFFTLTNQQYKQNLISKKPLINFFFGFQLIVSGFYFTAGLNKLIDVGPSWLFNLHLDKLSLTRIYEITFYNSRYANYYILDFLQSESFSIIAAFGTLLGELGLLIALIYAPRLMILPIILLILMHILILASTGINFMTNSALLIFTLPLANWGVYIKKNIIY